MVALLVGLGLVPGAVLLPPSAALVGNAGSFGNEGSKGLLHGWKQEVEMPLLTCLTQVSLANTPAQSWGITTFDATAHPDLAVT